MPKFMDELDLKVAEHIKAARRAAGWNQEQLARELGVTFQQVQKYENGTNRVSAGKLVRIAHVLGVPAADLLPRITQDGSETSALAKLSADKESLLHRLHSIRELATA